MRGHGFAVAWVLLSTLLWLGLIASVIWVGFRVGGGGGFGSGQRRENPREILDRRYAAGEIDAAAYDEARTRLGGTPR